MVTTSQAVNVDVESLVHQIRSEAGRAVRLMDINGTYKRETVTVLRSGSTPTVRNLFRRYKTEAYWLSHKGMFLLDASTGQPYMRCWHGDAPYCVPIDLPSLKLGRQLKLLHRIRRRIHECQ